MCLNIGELRHEAGNSIGSRDGDRLRERTASKFDAAYYRGQLEKAWGEAAFVFTQMARNKATR
jgi:predicted RNase H-like nuclease